MQPPSVSRDSGARVRVAQALADHSAIDLRQDVPLRDYTRFAIGGPADLVAETSDADAFTAAVGVCRRLEYPFYILGDGSNIVAGDEGFRGLILRFTAREIGRAENDDSLVEADAGAPLQALVDFAVDAALGGLETLARIPGSVGAAVYGNAGAYGHSISERVESVDLFDGERVRRLNNEECGFGYRESRFKHNKQWMIFRARFALLPGDARALRETADEITAVRDKKFPPSMRCAGSIFKNLHVKDLPQSVVSGIPEQAIRQGKVAAAYFLDRVGAKGMRRGGIRIADYHANLIYNAGGGTAAELRSLIEHLKQRVRERYGFEVEEEIQYVGEF